jgi:hypothetical protein
MAQQQAQHVQVHDKAHDKDKAEVRARTSPLVDAKGVTLPVGAPEAAAMVTVWDGYLVVLCNDGSLWCSVQKGPLYEPPLKWHEMEPPKRPEESIPIPPEEPITLP